MDKPFSGGLSMNVDRIGRWASMARICARSSRTFAGDDVAMDEYRARLNLAIAALEDALDELARVRERFDTTDHRAEVAIADRLRIDLELEQGNREPQPTTPAPPADRKVAA
jgi:hypothetical protein